MPKLGDSRVRKIIHNLLNWVRMNRVTQGFRKEPEPPLDPYAYVTAPKKPRPSNRSAAAVAELPEE